MKLIIVAEVIGREALHRYGHPIKFIKTDNLTSNKGKIILEKWKNDDKKDTRIFKAIYSSNKYRILKSIKKDVITTRLMVVDDDYEKVYKFCSINGSSILLNEFDEKFADLGLTLKKEMTKKEDRDSIVMLFDYKRINVLSYLFDFFGSIHEDVYDQFIKNHFDILIENYLDHGKISTMSSLIWNVTERGLIYKYIETKNYISSNVIYNIVDILYHAVFVERINIFNISTDVNPRFRFYSSYRFNCKNQEEADKKEYDTICNIFSIMFNFFERYFKSEYLMYDRESCAIEDFFVVSYFLMGKPEFKNSDKLIKDCGYNLSSIGDEPFTAAAFMTPYKKHLDKIFKNLTNKELSNLFYHNEFEPFKSYGIKDVGKLKWLSKDEETLKSYNELINRNDKQLTKSLNQRYRIPSTANTLCAINSLNSFDTTMFFIYMQSNYQLFIKDIEFLDLLFASCSSECVLMKLDCSKFINEKIKREFISILLIRLESKNTKEDLIKVFKRIKSKKEQVDKEIISEIKKSNFNKLKGAIKCSRL